MSPFQLLILAFAFTAAAVVATSVYRRQMRCGLIRLARETGFHYSAVDRFTLARRLRAAYPAFAPRAGLRVQDVMYRLVEHRRHFVFGVVCPPIHSTGRPTRQIVHATECSRNSVAQLSDIVVMDVDSESAESYQKLMDYAVERTGDLAKEKSFVSPM